MHACIVKDSVHLIGSVRQSEFNSLLHEVNDPSMRYKEAFPSVLLNHYSIYKRKGKKVAKWQVSKGNANSLKQ